MKKGEAMGVVVIVLVIVVFLAWFINESWKECRSDSDCNNGICNSNFECVSIQQNSGQNFNTGALILGVALIIAALIMKWDKIFKKKSSEKTEEEPEEKPKKLHKEHNAEEKCLYEDHLDEQE